jgi:hypothetical protein
MMDPDVALTDLLEAIRDKDREKSWGALEALNDWLAKGGAFPSKVRAVPMSDVDLVSILVALMAMIATMKVASLQGPSLTPNVQNEAALLGRRLTAYVEDADCLNSLNRLMKRFSGFNPNKPL